jgi:hypothetical protein
MVLSGTFRYLTGTGIASAAFDKLSPAEADPSKSNREGAKADAKVVAVVINLSKNYLLPL